MNRQVTCVEVYGCRYIIRFTELSGAISEHGLPIKISVDLVRIAGEFSIKRMESTCSLLCG
jgi:hypothetical protein